MAAESRTTRRPRGQSKKGVSGRFWERVIPEPNSGCWLWVGGRARYGYGTFYLNGRHVYAHRVSYEMHVGPIPAGLELDHKCRVPACVNPNHLEPVTHRENVKRGLAGIKTAEWQRSKTHCPNGHQYTADNIYYRSNGHRDCRTCSQKRSRDRQRLLRPTRSAAQKEKTRTYQREWMRRKRASVRALPAV